MFLRFDCVRVSVVDTHNCLHIVICSVSFNGVKIGWWPHARPGPAFPMLTIYYNLVFVYCPEKRRKKQNKTKNRWTLGAFSFGLVWFSMLIKYRADCVARADGQIDLRPARSSSHDEGNRRRTGDPVKWIVLLLWFSSFLPSKEQETASKESGTEWGEVLTVIFD